MGVIEEQARLVDEYDSLRVKYHLEQEPKPSVETFVQTRMDVARGEIERLCGDLRSQLVSLQVGIELGFHVGDYITKFDPVEAQTKLDEIKNLCERYVNDEKILDFIEQNEL